MSSTAIPRPVLGPTGYVAPAESALYAGAMADLQAAFGGGLNPGPKTPQGQLATSLAALIGNINDLFLFYVSQTDPAYARGRMQDAIGRIYFLERRPAQPTVVQAVCIGLDGVTIPAGALARADDDNLYVCQQTGTIGPSGTITLPFACTTPGPIACPAGALSTIYQAIAGWDTITNPQDGVLGAAVEGRADFEIRRRQSVAHNATGHLPAVRGAVLSVDGVIDAFTVQNDTNAPQTVGGYTLAGNSIYVSVAGGEADAIARAIWTRKSPGCGTNGSTTVTVLDTASGYSPPYPAYEVRFDYARPLPVLFAVEIKNSALVPSDATQQVQAALIAAFAGEDGGPRARIGAEILASRYYDPVQALGPWARIVSLRIGASTVPAATFRGALDGTQLQVIAAGSGALAVGQTILDDVGLVLPGTRVAALATGTGGAGTYALSASNPAITSRRLYAARPDQFRVPVGIDQVPSLSAANIVVTLV
ncbi:baseplate J/gp47 family protein [Methylobacterium frigidaeris]|uniref:Baseplate protein J-like barrel domain-containing protein n=2 Tax=Methylobacterium frigidaeris TaxID=2038277 RepID=A0AA37M5I8_9HYPH|nr:baseplate J/gp47 family protein [Methylobacterium frigidaeris]GJD63743.1 hypothetical protein MPEAHAMD_3914 [Methylobacterium frigidaeris]